MKHPADILNNLFPAAPPAAPARLVCQVEQLAEAAEVLRRFIRFGGEGWLCAADSPQIRRFSPPNPPDLAPDAFPLCGEAAAGHCSLHLQRGSEGWILTTIQREAGGEAELVLETTLLARDNQGDFRYETAWRPAAPDDPAGGEEIRPYAFRFAGFVPDRQEDRV